MKIAYFDCFAGISGDMCLGAIADAGVDIAELEKALKNLPLENFKLAGKKVLRAGISATKVDVIIQKRKRTDKGTEAKRWHDIEKIIKNSTLKKKIKQKGLSIFKKLFKAEARVHGEPFEEVHLHELGGIDCIADIFGTLIGLDMLGVEKVYASSINLGGGAVRTEHGILPVPAPATAELLKGYAVYSSGIPFELTTPTGAAIIAGLESEQLSVPHIKVEQIGYGAGNKEIEDMPNALRIVIGREGNVYGNRETGSAVTVIETNIDDMNPQIYEDVIEKLFKAGALDVFLENIVMKKSRPAVKLTVIADKLRVESLASLLFRETTTIGIRFYDARRKVMDREIRKLKTKYGDARVKISKLGKDVLNISPEYDDLKALSRKTGIPVKKLSEEITAAARAVFGY